MTDFSNMSFTGAANGFVIEHDYGTRRVFMSFTEAAEYFGEPRAALTVTTVHYAAGADLDTLRKVRREFDAGNKITAIGVLRDTFNPRLGLREAKDLVEILCGGN